MMSRRKVTLRVVYICLPVVLVFFKWYGGSLIDYVNYSTQVDWNSMNWIKRYIKSAVQSQKAVPTHFSSEQVLPFASSWQNSTEDIYTFPPVPTSLAVSSTYDIGENSLRILFWTGWARNADSWWWLGHKTSMVTCGGYTCQYTNDKSLYDVSHGILFYFNFNRIGKTPRRKIFPQNRDPKQYWIAQFQGPPCNHHHKSLDSFKNVFNLSSNFHQKADIHTPYGVCQKSLQAENLLDNYSTGKTGLVSWFVSHCETISQREKYVEILRHYIDVDIYGECEGRGSIRKVCADHRVLNQNCEDARQVMNSYKFYLAFESTICTDYASEKLYKILQANMRTVPIIRNGVDNMEDILPPHSYIDARKFDSPKQLAKYLKLLDSDDDLYNKYFAWRAEYTCELGWIPCTFCRSFHKMYGKQGTLYTNPNEIFNLTQNCEGFPTDISDDV